MGKTFIDIILWARINTLLVLRRPKMLHLINSCVWPLVAVYNEFKRNEQSNLYRINHSSSVAHLEGVLNDRFDYTLRRIYISDAMFLQALYIYRAIEQIPKFIYTPSEAQPKYIYNDSELSNSNAFIVNIPIGLGYDNAQLVATLNSYKLPGSIYTINLY